MEHLTDEVLESYFTRYGWSFDHVETAVFRTAFRGDQAAFAAFVRYSPHWVVFSIQPYLQPPAGGFGLISLRALAHANQSVPLVKLGVDEDGDAFMSVELPAEAFTYSHFSEALSALAYFANALFVPLLQARALDERNAGSTPQG